MKLQLTGLLILTFLIPLGRFPIMFWESFQLSQLELLYIIFASFLLIWGLFNSTRRFKGKSEKGSSIDTRKNPLYIPFGLFGLFILLSALSLTWTISYYATSRQIFFFVFYLVIFFLSFNIVRDNDYREKFLLVLLFSTLFVSLYAIYQYYWGLEETRRFLLLHKEDFPLAKLDSFMARLYTDRAFSTFLHPPALASFLIMVFPFSVFYSLFSKNKKKWLLWIIPPLIMFALILTFSEGGIIALTLSWVALLIAKVNPVRKGRVLDLGLSKNKEVGLYLSQPQGAGLSNGVKKRQKLLILSVIVLVGGVLIMLAHGKGHIDEKLMPPSLRVRVEYWQAGWEMVKERPLLGFGLGSFGRIYTKYKLPHAEETYLAHNNFLQIWTELGIVGLLIFTGIFFFYFREMNKKLKELKSFSSMEKTFILGGYVSVWAFVFHSLVDFSLYLFSLSFILFLIMGVSLKVGSQNQKKLAPKIARKLSFPILIGTSVFIFITLRPLIAEIHATKAHQYMQSGNFEGAIEKLKQAINWWDWGENEYRQSYHFLVARLYKEKMLKERETFTPQIIRHLRKAIENDQYRSLYWRELALVRWMRNEMIEAIESMKKAISCYPVHPLNYIILGDMYASLEKKEAALNEYMQALKYDQYDPPSWREIIDERIKSLK